MKNIIPRSPKIDSQAFSGSNRLIDISFENWQFACGVLNKNKLQGIIRGFQLSKPVDVKHQNLDLRISIRSRVIASSKLVHANKFYLAPFEECKQSFNGDYMQKRVERAGLVCPAIIIMSLWVVLSVFVTVPNLIEGGLFFDGNVVVDESQKLTVANNNVTEPSTLKVEPLLYKGVGDGLNTVVPFFSLGNAEVTALGKVNTEAKHNKVAEQKQHPFVGFVTYVHLWLVILSVWWVIYVTDFFYDAKGFFLSIFSKFSNKAS
jgi:hypothetical protein